MQTCTSVHFHFFQYELSTTDGTRWELLHGTGSSQLSAKTKPRRQSEKTFKVGLWRLDKLCNSVSTGCLCCTGLDWLQLSWVWTWDSTKRITHTLTSSCLLVGTWRPLSQRTKCLVLAVAIPMSQYLYLVLALGGYCVQYGLMQSRLVLLGSKCRVLAAPTDIHSCLLQTFICPCSVFWCRYLTGGFFSLSLIWLTPQILTLCSQQTIFPCTLAQLELEFRGPLYSAYEPQNSSLSTNPCSCNCYPCFWHPLVFPSHDVSSRP